METDLETLAATIAAHARELAGKEWHDEHRSVLMQILEAAGLAERGATCGTLTIGDREVPTEAIVKALQEHFLSKRTKELIRKLTYQVVSSAARRVKDDEEDQTRH